jgi:cytochrome b561
MTILKVFHGRGGLRAPVTTETHGQVRVSDIRTRYDPVAMALHWSTALLVVIQFILAQTWGEFPRPIHGAMVIAHMSFGVLLAAVIALRLAWRLRPGHQRPPAQPGLEGLAAGVVRGAFYPLIAAQAGLGFMLRWSHLQSMSFFGLLIPPPFAPLSRHAHDRLAQPTCGSAGS